MHGPTLASAATGDFPEELAHDGASGDAFAEGVDVVTVCADD